MLTRGRANTKKQHSKQGEKWQEQQKQSEITL